MRRSRSQGRSRGSERSDAGRRAEPERSRWVVTERVHPQGEEGLRWVFLSFARGSSEPLATEPPPGSG